MNKNKVIALAMAALGLASGWHSAADEMTVQDKYVNQEAKRLLGSQKDKQSCVYGGPKNHIKSQIYGTVKDKSGNPLSDIRLMVYSDQSLIGSAVTDEKGTFTVESLSVWAGVGVEYMLIAVDPQEKYESAKISVKFEMREYNRREDIVLEAKR